MRSKKLFALLATLALTVSVLSACGNSSNNDASPAPAASVAPAASAAAPAASATPTASAAPVAAPAPTGKNSWVVATENEPDSITTVEHNATASNYINQLTYSGLFKQHESLAMVPNLVKSYKAISDTEWEMEIYQGVKFHDGTELTSADVKATVEYAKNFLIVEQFTQGIKGVEIIDDYTFVLSTFTPSSTVFSDLASAAHYILPKAAIDSGHNFGEQPIGTGPYKFTKWNLGDSLQFERFEDYFSDESNSTIDKLEWRIIPEGSSRTIALENGEIDMIVEVATIDVDRLDASSDIVLMMKPSTTHNYLMINNELPAFSNQKVRQALNAAIDREAIVEVATNGLAIPVYTQAPIGFPGSTDADIITYDPELAKELMAESGVDPSTIKFSMICSNEEKRRSAEVIQANLLELGITAEIETMDLATYLAQTSEGNYTAAIGGYTSSNLVTYLKGVHSSKQIGGANRSRCNNPEIDALIEKSETTADDAARIAFENECISLLNQWAPQIPLYQAQIIRAYNKNLEGLIFTGTGSMYFDNLRWAE